MIEVPEPDSYDPATLREVFDDPAQVSRVIDTLQLALDAPADPEDPIEELYHRGMLVSFLRVAGRLDEARTQGLAALERARQVGAPAQRQSARLRLAQVLQRQGEFTGSTVLFDEVLADADRFGPLMAGFAHQQAGTNFFDQQLFEQAHEQFGLALAARRRVEAPDDQIAASVQALELAARRRGVQS